jgi:hypothetical protein
MTNEFKVKDHVTITGCPNEELNGKLGWVMAIVVLNGEKQIYNVGLMEPMENGNMAINVPSEFLTPLKKKEPEPLSNEETAEGKMGKKVHIYIKSMDMFATGKIVDTGRANGADIIAVDMDFLIDPKEAWYGKSFLSNIVLVPETDIITLN